MIYNLGLEKLFCIRVDNNSNLTLNEWSNHSLILYQPRAGFVIQYKNMGILIHHQMDKPKNDILH